MKQKKSKDFSKAKKRKRRSQKVNFNVQIKISKIDTKRIEEEYRASKLLVRLWGKKTEKRRNKQQE